MDPRDEMTIDDVIHELDQILNRDFERCIVHCFKLLDIRMLHTISVITLRHACLLQIRLMRESKALKVIKVMNRLLNDDYVVENYTQARFAHFMK